MKKLFVMGSLLVSVIGCSKNLSINGSTVGTLEIKSGNFITDSSNNCSTNNCQKLRKEFDYVVSTGKKIYCYWDLKKATTKNDYEAIAQELKTSINDQTSLYEYYLILRKWASSLQDGHVNAMWGGDKEPLQELVVPVTLELLAPGTDHESLIVYKNSAATKSLPVGAVVTKVNGVNAIDRINSIEKYMSGSTSRMRRIAATRLIFSVMSSRKEEKSAVKIEYTLNGVSGSVDAPRIVTLPFNVKKSPLQIDAPLDLNNLVQVQILPNNIGYLRIDGFQGGDDMSSLLERSLKILDETSALIIDVRQNGGGDQSGNAIIAHLISQRVARYHSRTRISDLVMQEREEDFLDVNFNDSDIFTPFIDQNVNPVAPKYNGKVYVLTSPRCFSACDTFTSALKENKLATIVGEGTGGGTGSPHVFSLNFSGLSFRYSVVQGLTAVGNQYLEGVGTLPDVEIFPTVEERIKNEDQQLLKTINLAAKEASLEVVAKENVADLISNKSVNDSVGYSLDQENSELKLSQEY